MSGFEPPSDPGSVPSPGEPHSPPPIPSVGRALEQAFSRTRTVLFTHGSFSGWLTLGFASFLAFMFESQSFSFSNEGTTMIPWPQPSQNPMGYLRQQFGAWLPLIVVGGVIALALGVALLWVRSRGRFVFLQGVLKARPAIVEPWRNSRRLANSFFAFWLLLASVAGALLFIAAGLALALGWEDIQHQRLTAGGYAALALLVTAGLVVSVGYGFTKLLMDDMLLPTMYAHNVNWRQGWAIIRSEVARPHAGATALYLLMRVGAAIVLAIIETATACLTCCLVMIPYIGNVILLPVEVFRRCLALTFLEQLGPSWAMFDLPAQEPRCPRCGYDLRGNPQATNCPECGAPVAANLPQTSASSRV